MDLRVYVIEIRKQLRLSIESAKEMNTVESIARANAYRHVLESVHNALKASEGNPDSQSSANCAIFDVIASATCKTCVHLSKNLKAQFEHEKWHCIHTALFITDPANHTCNDHSKEHLL